MEFKPTLKTNGFNLIFNDYNTYKPFIKVNNFNSNNENKVNDNDLIKDIELRLKNKRNIVINNNDIDLSFKNDISYKCVENNNFKDNKIREYFLYPNIALNEKYINGFLYPFNNNDIIDNDINKYDNNEYKTIINRLKKISVNREFSLLLENDFNINTNLLFIKGNKENKENCFKLFCEHFIKYCLNTKLNNITKKDLFDLMININKSKDVKIKKVKKVFDYLINIGFINKESFNKSNYRYRIIKLKTFDGLIINQKELNKYIFDKTNKDLFDLMNVNNSIKPTITFKPYSYLLFSNGFIKKYYIYKDKKKTYIYSSSILEKIKTIDFKIKIFNYCYKTNITKEDYLNNDYFIIKKNNPLNFTNNKKDLRVYKKDFRKLFKNLNIGCDIVSYKIRDKQKVTTLNQFSLKLVLNSISIKNNFKVNLDYNLNNLSKIDIKNINTNKVKNTNRISYKDLLKIIKVK